MYIVWGAKEKLEMIKEQYCKKLIAEVVDEN